MAWSDAVRRLVVSVGICLAIAAAASAAPPPEPAAPAAAAPDTSPLVVEGIISAPPAELWKVFSTAEGFKAFGVAQCDMDFKPGGLIRTHYDPKGVLGDEGTIQNRILAYETERMIAFRIDKPPAKFPFPSAWQSTWSVATLTDLGDGRTKLRLTGMGYTADEESQKMREFFKAGNAWSMQKLQHQFDASVKVAPPAQAHADDPISPIELDAVIAAPREEVFQTYTSSAGWKSFFMVESKIELRPGGPFEIYFSMDPPAGSRGSEGCTVLSYIPSRMFSYTWNAPPKFTGARGEHTWVVVTFEDIGSASTRVHMSHLGFAEQAAAHPDRAEEYKQVRAYFASAWPHVLTALKQKWQPSTLQVEPVAK
jgi:uncharacterized protein YndB with AHSA1/START domain